MRGGFSRAVGKSADRVTFHRIECCGGRCEKNVTVGRDQIPAAMPVCA
jgi:hypothetical protein